MLGIIGKKIGMTTLYNGEGHSIPCTAIEGGPCVVTQIKTLATDGYQAVQLGYADKKEKHTTQPLQGHFKKANCTPKRKLVEFKNFSEDLDMQLGQTLSLIHI